MNFRRTGAFLLAMAVLWIALAGCERSGGGLSEDASTDERASFPVLEGATSIRVALEADGTNILSIDDRWTAGRLAEQLRTQAKPSYFGDPEPHGRLYKVELSGADSRGQTYTYAFTLNDMTETDALRDAAKVYLDREDGTSEAWMVPSGWIRALFGYQAMVDPLLYITTANESASVIVQANRRIRTASVPAAVAETLQVAGLAPGEKPPGYKIHWSDPQRFVVRFDSLPEGVSVRVRFDGLISAEGDSFANAEAPSFNAATLTSATAWGGVVWADADGRVERRRDVGEAALLGPLDGDGVEGMLAYGIDGRLTWVDLSTGATQALKDVAWPEARTPFGNDYGADVLYADRVRDGDVFAVYGNRMLYRVGLDAGDATKLYESKSPVKAVATSPDGRRVALLVNPEGTLAGEGDVLVLSEGGEPLSSAPGATFGGHSDGFLFPLPMRWVDDRTVAVQRYDAERSVAYVDADDGAIRVEPGARLPETAERPLGEQVGWPAEALRVLPEPGGGGSRYAVQTREGAWLVDASASQATWLGAGMPLRWTQDGRIAVWMQPSSERNAYVLGMP